MDELHETAGAYYAAAAASIKENAKEFFNSIDQDKDRRISLHEFLAYMKREGFIQMATPTFFKALNKDGSGTLSFMDVMTLYYIVESGRQFCDGCGEFMKGLFFTCSKCFEDCNTTFNVCPSCFKLGLYVHDHKQFLDNYVLLETKRLRALKEKERPKPKPKAAAAAAAHVNQATIPQSIFLEPIPCSASTQIVLYNGGPRKKSRWLTTIAGGAAAALSGCSIM